MGFWVLCGGRERATACAGGGKKREHEKKEEEIARGRGERNTEKGRAEVSRWRRRGGGGGGGGRKEL